MTFHIEVNEEDYIQYNLQHVQNSKQGKRAIQRYRMRFVILGIAGLVMLAVFRMMTPLSPLITGFYVLLLTYCAVMAVMARKLYMLIYRRHILRAKKDGGLPYARDYTVEFGEDGYVTTTENSTHRIAYSEINALIHSEDYIMLFYDAIRGTIIPLRCLKYGEAETLYAMLKEKCTNLTE